MISFDHVYKEYVTKDKVKLATLINPIAIGEEIDCHMKPKIKLLSWL